MQPEDVLKKIYPAPPRSDVQVTLGNGRVLGGPAGTPLEAFIQKAAGPQAPTVVAALLNDRLVELCTPVTTDAVVSPISVTSEEGMRIYQRSVALLLESVLRDLFPDVRVTVDHALTFGGLYCRVLNRAPLTDEELARIETAMRARVAADEPIVRVPMTIAEAAEFFRTRGEEGKAQLLEQTKTGAITLHALGSTREYFYDGLLAPSAGYLRHFALRNFPPGFGLQMPQRHRPTQMQAERATPKLTAVFREYGEWLALLGVPDVAALNHALGNSRIREIAWVSEALHDQRIAEIATQIVESSQRVQLIAIAGPSSSGKTTFSRRLAIQLLANGLRPFPVSIDDYFLPREQTPRDAQGNYDFESLHAVNLDLFNAHLLALMNGERVTLPRYNFQRGVPEEGPTVQLSPGHLLVIEGIHGLNPALLSQIPAEKTFRISVSPLTQLKLDRLNRISTTDARLVRRIVRDAQTRSHSARATIAQWESVRRGEEEYIFPFQENADVLFNSALVYELAVLKPLAEPLLRQVEPGTAEYIEARRLLTFLQWFQPCESALVPEDSILREFIGESAITDFVPQI
jgi:uridine kinase